MFGSLPTPQPGSAAPPFTLPSTDGQEVSLVHFRDKKRVILAFYVEDDTPG